MNLDFGNCISAINCCILQFHMYTEVYDCCSIQSTEHDRTEAISMVSESVLSLAVCNGGGGGRGDVPLVPLVPIVNTCMRTKKK